jgi:hypothetical protein
LCLSSEAFLSFFFHASLTHTHTHTHTHTSLSHLFLCFLHSNAICPFISLPRSYTLVQKVDSLFSNRKNISNSIVFVVDVFCALSFKKRSV